ncbi:DarT ssDNA thymidine ADP-ribosyltransferase family protein [Pseudooceanicola nanhaiensis]|uniref:DarT ssDNA thymidine ADP-ribosyltransferase family protein n=1 Tax=Pseudooceanicola nanhaiensis TaxID=375761 RepID=UPI004058489E
MALSDAFVDRHIAYWTSELEASYREYRKHWPRFLFHHAPLENAVGILNDGHLRARNDPHRTSALDVAAQGVIDNSTAAHDRVRLYFRPRTPTQFHIEGIQKPGECHYGANAHAPVLVMFVLDAKSILTRPDVQFSDRNMQRLDVRTGSDEAFFNTIDFAKVYHEGGTGGDSSIIACRCAEVLPTTPLRLTDHLEGIWCRSEPERDTLLHKLGGGRAAWEKQCQVSEALKVFDKRFAFVEALSLSQEGVSFRLNHRHDLGTISLNIEAFDETGVRRVNYQNSAFTTYNTSGGRWIHRTNLAPSNYAVRVSIDGHLAFEANIALEDSLF